MDFSNGAYVNLNGWRFQKLKNNYIKIFYMASSDNQIGMLGSDVATVLSLPFVHRLINTRLFNTTGVHVASSDALNIKLERKQAMPKWETELLIDTIGWTLPHFRWNGGIGWEFEPSEYTLTLNTTNTNRITPVFLIQNLE